VDDTTAKVTQALHHKQEGGFKEGKLMKLMVRARKDCPRDKQVVTAISVVALCRRYVS